MTRAEHIAHMLLKIVTTLPQSEWESEIVKLMRKVLLGLEPRKG